MAEDAEEIPVGPFHLLIADRGGDGHAADGREGVNVARAIERHI
jgi:hypothetical protein